MGLMGALIRDGFRCVVTGSYHYDTLSEVSASADEIKKARVLFTECAHIVPEFPYFDVSDQSSSNEKLDYSASLLAVLMCFGYDIQKLNGDKVHSLFNVMTLEHNVHVLFDRLKIWFEKTDVTDCYNIRSFEPQFFEFPTQVTFTTSDNEQLPVPSAALLTLHATCAKVAHLSGAAERIDKLDRDAEDLGVLAHDGSSGVVLSNALLNHMNQVIGIGA
ncbi:hypothetical protein IW262DRAFT_1449609 [Armillaria fumosa]|nr:hypothetical protein IW262DRAFT_1449609 [Armillaria fumosa]